MRDASDLFDVAVDPKNGNLYAVWQDARFLSAHVDTVAFSMSTDGGKTWSQPAPVAQTPFSDDDLLNQSFIPSIEVAANGTLVVTYYDFRNDRKAGGEATDYWAVFCDPGKSNCANYAQWGGEVRLTDKPFDMLDAPEAGGHFLGDYMGLTRAGNAVVPVFGVADGKNQTSLYTRRITFGGKAQVASAAGQ